MHVRITVFEGEPAKIPELVTFVRSRGVAHVRTLSGNLGLTMTVDRDRGRCHVTVPFTSLGTLRASTGAVGPMRGVGSAIMNARQNPEVLEVLAGRFEDSSSDELVGCWESTARFTLGDNCHADPLPVLQEELRPLRERDEVRAVEILSSGSIYTIGVSCIERVAAAEALAATLPTCTEIIGPRTAGADTREIVVDARPLSDTTF